MAAGLENENIPDLRDCADMIAGRAGRAADIPGRCVGGEPMGWTQTAPGRAVDLGYGAADWPESYDPIAAGAGRELGAG